MLKKLCVLVLCLCLLLAFALPAAADSHVLVIRTAEELLTFAENCRLDRYSQDLTVSLEADVDLQGKDFTGIPIFCGIFRGNGHTVSGVELKVEGSNQGFFRYLTASAQVQDLHVAGKVQPSGSRSNVGGLVGSNSGSLKNCSFAGLVSGADAVGGLIGVNTLTGIAENCHAEGSVSGAHFVGGIVGDNRGVIRGVSNLSQVNTTAAENTVEISDITMETLTNTETATAVTDIGGIAGTNSGVLRNCENRGAVGYRQMGYNVGGIAGSQRGYVVDCENYVEVFGRKEVGGIVGQMEPVTQIEYSEDTVQLLQKQLESMAATASAVASGLENDASDMASQMGDLEKQITDAMEALEQLTPEDEEAGLPDEDTLQAAQNVLSGALNDMSGTLSTMADTAQKTADGTSKRLQTMMDQMGAIGATVNGATDHLGGGFTDISDQDTPEDVTGKVASCINYGSVHADRNAGGIVGAMSMENDLDPEDDLDITGDMSLHFDGKLRCVVASCENKVSIAAGKENAGGIVGQQLLGLVSDSINTGTVGAETGEYVGGIAGNSAASIRRSSAKCVLSGSRFVGGIAGSGLRVTDCRAMVKVTGDENTGAVLGAASPSNTESIVRGNYYVNIDPALGGIDGIGYADAAEPLTEAEFMALEDLPDLYEAVTVRFVQENGKQKVITLKPGSSLLEADIPAVTEKEGCVGYWKDLSPEKLVDILFDMTFTAQYTAHDTVISSVGTRKDGRPLLLVQGDFPEGTAVSMQVVSKADTIECWGFTLTEGQTAQQLRYLLPETVSAEKIMLMLRKDGSWQAAEFTVNGSYLVFGVDSQVDGFCIIEVPADHTWLLIAAGAGALVIVVVTGVICYHKSARKKKNKIEKA